MFEPLSGLFNEEERRSIRQTDVHHLIQRFLRDVMIGDDAHCQPIVGSKVVIRAANPVVSQELRLLEYDIKKLVKEEVDITLKEIQVI